MESSNTQSQGNSAVRDLVVANKMGIHARPAAMIVRITSKFKSEIFFEKDDEQVNGKSIMGLMMLAAGNGTTIKAIATGEDSSRLLDSLEELFAKKFDER